MICVILVIDGMRGMLTTFTFQHSL